MDRQAVTAVSGRHEPLLVQAGQAAFTRETQGTLVDSLCSLPMHLPGDAKVAVVEATQGLE